MAGEDTETTGQAQSRYKPLILVAGAHSFTHMFGALMPLVYPFIIVEYGITYAAIGLLEGVARFSGGLLQGPAGLLGRFMPRRLLIGMNNILLALSMGCIGISPNFASFFSANVAARIVQSPQHPIGNSLISEWFGKKLRGTAFAINYGGANVGSIIVPLIAGALFTWIGWRGTVGAFMIPGLVFGFLAIIVLRQAGKVATIGSSKPALRGEILKALKDNNSRLVIVSSLVAAGARGLGILNVYVPLYLRDTMRGGLGLGAMTTSVLFTILMIGSVVGPLFVGRISDRLGRARVLEITLFLSSLCAFALVLSGDNLFLVVLVLLVMGFSSYPFSMLYQTLLADVAHPSVRDLAFSLYFPLSFVAGALWTFGLGLVADQFNFQLLFIIVAFLPLAALPLIFAVKE